MSDDIERNLARIRARDEVNELVEERATALAESEGSTVFRPLHDDPNNQKIRDEYRARVRRELGLPGKG